MSGVNGIKEYGYPVITMACSSFQHVIDRAHALLFAGCDNGYTVHGIRPNAVILTRKVTWENVTVRAYYEVRSEGRPQL